MAELINTRLAGTDLEERLCPDLGSYIRYGVSSPESLILMTSGIRSRRLAHAIADDLPADLEPGREQLRLHIARIGVAGWRARYGASAAEVLDLLDFTRVRNRSLLRTLLETGNVTLDLPPAAMLPPEQAGPLTLEPVREEPFPSPWPSTPGIGGSPQSPPRTRQTCQRSSTQVWLSSWKSAAAPATPPCPSPCRSPTRLTEPASSAMPIPRGIIASRRCLRQSLSPRPGAGPIIVRARASSCTHRVHRRPAAIRHQPR